jgi:hypothetical protein
MDLSFQELTELAEKEKGVWVRLSNGDTRICLVGVKDPINKVFIAKFVPCAKNSRMYEIHYSDIKCLNKEKSQEENHAI